MSAADIQIDNPQQRVYELTPKHTATGYGTSMDLDPNAATQVLRTALPADNRKTLWGYHNGTVYRFMHNNRTPGVWHGYVTEECAPTSVLRQWRTDGVITNAQYKKMLLRPQRAL